jgi:hypothetical protein
MTTKTTFSGLFETVATGQPDKKFEYKGSIGSNNGKLSFDIETDLNGVVSKLAKDDVSMEELKTDPDVQAFLMSLKESAQAKRPTKRKAKRKKTAKRK